MFFVDEKIALVLVQLFPTLLIALAVESRSAIRNEGFRLFQLAVRSVAVIAGVTATFTLVLTIQSGEGSALADWWTTIAFWALNAAVIMWALNWLFPAESKSGKTEQ